MDPTILMSFPRSGLHCIKDTIQEIALIQKIPFSFCEYYNCCRKCPCTHNCTLMKNHDFLDDTQPIIPNHKYIVLYREDMIEQLEAWYRCLNVNSTNKPYNLKDCKKFVTTHIPYYINFVSKWVLADTDYLKITYDDLLENPINIITKVFCYLYPNIPPNSKIINDVIKRRNIKKRYHLSPENYRFLSN